MLTGYSFDAVTGQEISLANNVHNAANLFLHFDFEQITQARYKTVVNIRSASRQILLLLERATLTASLSFQSLC